jgi:hypothetical protein
MGEDTYIVIVTALGMFVIPARVLMVWPISGRISVLIMVVTTGVLIMRILIMVARMIIVVMSVCTSTLYLSVDA